MKTYLGDGAYAEFTGYSIILTTENGISVQNEIHLEERELEAALPEHIDTLFEGPYVWHVFGNVNACE